MASSPNLRYEYYKELVRSGKIEGSLFGSESSNKDYQAWKTLKLEEWEQRQEALDESRLNEATSSAVDGKVYVYTNKTGGGLDDPDNYKVMTLDEFQNLPDPSIYRIYSKEDYYNRVSSAKIDQLEQAAIDSQERKDMALREKYNVSPDTPILRNDDIYSSLIRNPESTTLVDYGDNKIGVYGGNLTDTSLLLTRQTYAPLLNTAAAKEIDTTKPIYGIDNVSPLKDTGGNIIGGKDTITGQSVILPQAITSVRGVGYNDPYTKQSYYGDIYARSTLSQVMSQPISINNKQGKEIGIFDPVGKMSYSTNIPPPKPNQYGASLITRANKQSWKSILYEPGNFLLNEADKAEQLNLYQRSRGQFSTGSAASAFSLSAAGTAINIFRHFPRTVKEVFYDFPKALITEPSKTSYGIGEELKTRPMQFAGTQAGFILTGLAVKSAQTKLKSMTTYELDIPYNQYSRTQGRGGVNPTLSTAEKLNVNLPETSPVTVQRGGTLTSFIEIRGKRLFEKKYVDVGVVTVGDRAYLNIPKNKFQVQTYTTNVGKVPIKTWVGRQPTNSIRSVSQVTTDTPKSMLVNRDILAQSMPSGSVELETKGKINYRVVEPENYMGDFNSRIAAQETYSSITQSNKQTIGNKRVQTESINLATNQVLNIKATATPGRVEKKGYVDNQLKAVSIETTPTRFVFDENFKYQKNQLYAEKLGNVELLGRVKASELRQTQRGDIYTQGEIKIVDAPKKTAAKKSSPKLSKRWEEILNRAKKSDSEAQLSTIENTGYMKEKVLNKMITESTTKITTEPIKIKSPKSLNLPKLSSLFKSKGKLRVAPPVTKTNIKTSQPTTTTNKVITISRQKNNIGFKAARLPKTNYATSSTFNFKQSPMSSISFDTKSMTDVMPKTKTQSLTNSMSEVSPMDFAPPTITTKITTPMIPSTPTTPPPGLNFEWTYGKQKKTKSQFEGAEFSGRYVSSIEANLFNVRGKKNTLATRSGLGIRPI